MGSTLALSTSPVSLPSSGARVMPTSMTIAPGLMWRDLLQRLVGIEAVGQRDLDQDAVDRRVSSQVGDALVQLALGDVVQMLDRRLEADLFGGSLLAPDVSCRGRVIPHLDDGDARAALVRLAFDGALQLIANGARVGTAVDQAGRHRLSLARQIANLDWPRDLNGEAAQVRKWRPLADPNLYLDNPGLLEDGGRDPLGDRFEEVRRLPFEDLPGDLLQDRVAEGVVDAVARGRPLGVEHYFQVDGEGLAQLPFCRVVAVIAEAGQAGEDESPRRQTGRGPAARWRGRAVVRRFCRHVLTNIRVRVMMPR